MTISSVEHAWVDANGISVHTVSLGEGPLVVFCHGFPESWYSWRRQLPVVAEAGFRAMALDMRGYGTAYFNSLTVDVTAPRPPPAVLAASIHLTKLWPNPRSQLRHTVDQSSPLTASQSFMGSPIAAVECRHSQRLTQDHAARPSRRPAVLTSPSRCGPRLPVPTAIHRCDPRRRRRRTAPPAPRSASRDRRASGSRPGVAGAHDPEVGAGVSRELRPAAREFVEPVRDQTVARVGHRPIVQDVPRGFAAGPLVMSIPFAPPESSPSRVIRGTRGRKRITRGGNPL
ncbi:MAG: epoxide hydrolase [Mycobacterium sp.]|jgi:pimeloyl-ACP methyl ester carboxylesterase|nr:epoxide hydrolase [Mycobacterium sp.]